ncbi:M28 family metallopeptidase [Aquimonas sp.]|jgi:hypothetical protein|uniref:M28 family metallopeptidase n=1 Tax=Aquimonas sp. TaxID=1872588 RepID=UPI0037C0B071
MSTAHSRCLLAALSLIPWSAFAAGADTGQPAPSVIVDIRSAGAEGVAALKQSRDVRWSAEFGTELLLGIEPAALDAWLSRADTRSGPTLARDEIVVRDLVCTVHAPEPTVAIVGGYSLVRRPAALARVAGLGGLGGKPIPADGVVAVSSRNLALARPKQAPEPRTAAVVAAVDAERWFGTVQSLSDFDRNSFSADLGNAHNWILTRFSEAGLTTSSHAFTLNASGCSPTPPPVQINNPIGIKQGQTLPNEWIVVGAHYDSRNVGRCDGSAEPQPGANDNGSGCSGVIELARVFQNMPTARSIVFACFAGEEQGLVGAYAWVQSLQQSGQLAGVRHMVNLDMIGHAVDDGLATRLETTSTYFSQRQLYVDAAATYAPELTIILPANTQAYSDHWPFIAAGVPAVFTWENGAGIYPHYHQATDLPANMLRARAIGGGILRMDAAVVAQLAEVVITPPLFADGFE